MGDASYKTGLIFEEHDLQDNWLKTGTSLKQGSTLTHDDRFCLPVARPGRVGPARYKPDWSS